MKSNIDKLFDKREENENKVRELENDNFYLTMEMVKIAGNCPRCQNSHYPHC